MIVYANGCSFGLPVGENKTCYSEIIAKKFNAQLINKHIAGTGNRRLIRSSLRDLIEIGNTPNEKIVALIGLSFFFRTELWQPTKPANQNDGHFHPITTDFRPITDKKSWYYTGIEAEYKATDLAVRDWYKQHLLWQNKESIITDQLADIIMFASFCQEYNIDYLIWNNADVWPDSPEVDVNSPFLKDFVTCVLKNVNIVDPWNFAFLPWALSQGLRPIDEQIYAEYGHPGPEAHSRLAEFLIERLTHKENS